MTCFRTENRHHSVLPLAVMFCLTFATGKIQAQHSMPIPACPSRGVVAPGATGLWSLDGCYGCPAESAEGGAAEEPFDHILPDFLHEYEGISAEYIYTSEVFTVAHGGTTSSNATRYRGNLDLVLTGDTEAMDLWEGGRFFVYGNSYHGQALTGNFVGDAQFYSNIDSMPDIRPRRKSIPLVSELVCIYNPLYLEPNTAAITMLLFFWGFVFAVCCFKY